MLKCCHDTRQRNFGLNMSGNASARRHKWLKLFAYSYERIRHRHNNFSGQVLCVLIDNCRRRVPRRGNHDKFTLGGLVIVATRKFQLKVGPFFNQLVTNFLSTISISRAQHHFITNRRQSKPQSASGRTCASKKTDTHTWQRYPSAPFANELLAQVTGLTVVLRSGATQNPTPTNYR